MSLQFLSHNKRCFSRAATFLALGGGLLVLSPCVSVQAQSQPASGATKNVSLHLVNQPVQTALRLLFTSVGLNNSIDQAVQGSVTIDVNDVSFDTALHTLLQANTPALTYDKSGNVYHISVLQTAAPVAPALDQAPAPTTAPVQEGVHAYRIPIDHYDAYMIAELVAGVNVSSGGGQNGGQGGRRGGQNGQQGGGSVLMVPANDVLASGGSGSSQGGQGGFGGGQGGGFGGGGGGFGGGGGGFGGGGGGFGGGGGGGGFGGGSSGGGFGGF